MHSSDAVQPSRMRVVVLTCGDLGVEIANALLADGAVDVVGVVTAPYRTPKRSFKRKLQHVYRMQGWRGFASVLMAKLTPTRADNPGADSHVSTVALNPAIPRMDVGNFHDSNAIKILHDVGADLGIIAGTYVLKNTVFDVPRLGSINLHSGKVPAYRGAAPAFWELYNGENSVGITIHRVAAEVDAGNVLAQEDFSIDNVPAGDPIEYIENYRSEVLRPNGVRMMVNAVAALASGTAVDRPQDLSVARVFKTPDYRAKQELRRRILKRRGA
jgi:methionyl-tRNA formyltransferase